MINQCVIPSLFLACCLLACQSPHYGLKPSALQAYIAKVDAKATVAALHDHKKSVALTPKLHVKPQAKTNQLYSSSGQLIFSGSPFNQEQLVRLNKDGSTTVLDDFLSDDKGNYIAFTPRAIYHINKATDQTTKIPRVADVSK